MKKKSRLSPSATRPQPAARLGASPQTAMGVPMAAALAFLLGMAGAPAVRGGDILRGGRAGQAPTSRGITSQAPDPVASAAAVNARDALARTSTTINAIKAMQDAAHKQAVAGPANVAGLTYQGKALPPVPNGLAVGGLKVAPGVPANLKAPVAGENPALWTGAELPTQTKYDGATFVTIKQTDSRAVLNWQTFNVGKETTLTFDQTAGDTRRTQWIAFNKVNDPTGVPSQILGSIKSDGQVYVINRNGIVFGGSSVVNTHTLVASSLPINDNLIARGLLNQETKNPQFLFSSILTDPTFTLSGGATTYTLAQTMADGTAPKLSYESGGTNPLSATTDYTVGKNGAGQTVVTFTATGQGKVAGSPITATYAGQSGDVVVQSGAKLTSPTTPAKVGGRLALVGPNVTNNGTMSAPDGQVILAAGRQVGFAAHPSTDPSLRGLDVYVGQTDARSGVARNAGLISVPRGSATIAGSSVEHVAAIDSSTSVSLNGRVDLLANFGAVPNLAYDPVAGTSNVPFLIGSTGTVTLGAGSVTRIMPESSSQEKVVGTELALRSRANIQGRVVHLAENASLLAPNAIVNVDAGLWRLDASSTTPINTFLHTGGQIYLDHGATINVAGTPDVRVAIQQNFLTLQLRGAELADSPLQRSGVLRGMTLTVDIRNAGVSNGLGYVGTPLGDASGFAGLIERTVDELTVGGGSVTLQSGGSVVLQAGSKIDVSGGYVRYKGGMVGTSRVLVGSQLVDVAQATPDQIYSGMYTGTFVRTSTKWGVAETFHNALGTTGQHFEESYIQGASGGSIVITAPSMALDGELAGHTVNGPRQRATPAALSSISFGFTGEIAGPSVAPIITSPTPPSIVFSDLKLAAVDPFHLDANGDPAPLSGERLSQVALSPSLFTSSGFGEVTVDNGDGEILVPADVELSAPVNGALTLRGANISILGKVRAPGGRLAFSAYNTSPYAALDSDSLTLPVPNPGRGSFILGPTSLSAAGLIVDDRRGILNGVPLATAGGSLTIEAFRTELQAGSVVDVSGGVGVTPRGVITYTSGGTLRIAGGQDPRAKSIVGGNLTLNGELRGYSGGQGASLTLLAPRVVVAEGATSGAGVLGLTPAFFSQGGFTSFNVTGLGTRDAATGGTLPGVYIAPGTVLEPVAQSWLAYNTGDGLDETVLKPMVRPVGQRSPFSITFNAPGVALPAGSLAIRGDLVLGAGAAIRVDPRGSVSLTGQTVAVYGSIRAPGGSITVTGASSFPVPVTEANNVTNAKATVYLASGSSLDASGTTLLTPDNFGRRTGTVLQGGSIRVAGNIVGDAGATLNVSGASGTLDLAPAQIQPPSTFNDQYTTQALVPATSGLNHPLWKIASVPTRVDSDGGTITLQGGQELFVDSTLLGQAGGPTALGGTLAVSSGRFYAPDTLPANRSNADINLVVTQSGTTHSASGGPVIGQAVLGANGQPLTAMGHFAVDRFTGGGFDSLTLGGNVQFSGTVAIDARRELSVASGGVLSANGDVLLRAGHVTLGQPFLAPLGSGEALPIFTNGLNEATVFAPTYGRGRLTVEAPLIDIGNLSLQQIGLTRLIAQNGDIRGDGTLDAAGELYLRAGQIYPATATTFTIATYDKTVAVATSTLGSSTVTLASATLPRGFGVGSPLLGSTVQAINGATVTLTAGANKTITQSTLAIFAPGSITVDAAGARQLPLSAGGTLNLYASEITQNGTLRAPLGSINIGWDGTGTAPRDPLARQDVAVSGKVTLGAKSVTSVSAYDPLTGKGIVVPFGFSSNGTDFISPAGVDISAGLVPQKAVTIAGQSVAMLRGSLIDQSGGGDLYAYRFNPGNGGTTDYLGWNLVGAWNSGTLYKETQIVSYQGAFYYARTDLDATTAASAPTPGANWRQVSQSFAVLPGYEANYAPFARFNSTTNPGYTGTVSVGDRLHLEGSDTLQAGDYTLLPARYALLPGAVLVTPQSGTLLGTFQMLDRSVSVAGFRYNDLNGNREVNQIYSRFEVASSEVVRSRGEYQDFYANKFLAERADALGLKMPRLPKDAGHTILQATQSMQLDGFIASSGGGSSGRGGLIDISSTSDILVAGSGAQGPAGTLVLDASRLGSYRAESILIGGTRTLGIEADTVHVRTVNLTVDNAGSPLSAPDLILVAKEKLTIAANAQIIQTDHIDGHADPLVIGDASVPGSGDGVLLRVSADPAAGVTRQGIGTATTANLTIGAGAVISGAGLILDSTAKMSIDALATLKADRIAISTNRISLRLPQLDPAVTTPTDGTLVLGGALLEKLQSVQTLSLLSYSTLDVFGSGLFQSAGSLALHAGTIRGFGNQGGTADFRASAILLDNAAHGGHPAAGAMSGTLAFNAGTITVGANPLFIDQFASVELNAANNLHLTGNGSLNTQGDLIATTPSLTASARATQALNAGGQLTVQAPAGGSRNLESGLGASVTLEGASVKVTSDISLPSGVLTLHARTGNLTVGGHLDVNGTAQEFYDVTRYTNAGQLRLQADAGSVLVGSTAVLSVSAAPGGGNAGTLTIATPGGALTLDGKLLGQAGGGGTGGNFELDTLSAPNFSSSANPDLSLLGQLTTAGFNESLKFRVRTGNVTLASTVQARAFSLSADDGSITVSGTIDVSGATGGSIALVASNSVTLLSGATLDASAANFSNAGKGGTVALETRGKNGGVIDVQTGSKIDLSVDVVANAADPAATKAAAEALGKFTGTLHLRAPQTGNSTGLAINPLNGTIVGASSVTAEGYKVYQLSGATGTITVTTQNSISTNGQAFGANAENIQNSLLLNQGALAPIFSVLAGAEIINPDGNLTLGTANSTAAADWNLGDQAKYRFGLKKAPGVLTLRAAGDIVFYNALSDGFATAAYNAQLLGPNAALPMNAQTWSYRITAGADLTAADVHAVQAPSVLAATGLGSILIGKNAGTNQSPTSGSAASTSAAVGNRFQSIRTGSGSIEVNAGRDVQFLNQFSNIYTAGTKLADATLNNTFDLPKGVLNNANGTLGNNQQVPAYPAQYTLAGGDISITAQGDILRLTRDINGDPIIDSEKELPTNWLYRRGAVDPVTGLFAKSRFAEIASTTWWVDFSNFFEGVGALGGGNVSLTAGGTVQNIDAVVPTNARMPGKNSGGLAIAPQAASLVELGGGDIRITAGGNIDGGVYYVERGHGTLDAGAEITTNETRTPSLGRFTSPDAILAPESWLPTTLFVGKGSFDVTARGDLLLGPVANPFLLPQGFSNTYWYKTYFSTYATSDSVNVSSVGGAVTLREQIVLPTDATSVGTSIPLLTAWYDQVLHFDANTPTPSYYQPWLRLAESSVTQFQTVSSLLPANLRLTSFSSDVNIVGSFSMAASPTGQLELLAAGAVNTLQINGTTLINGQSVTVWDTAQINVSDSDPNALVGIANPFAYQTLLPSPTSNQANASTGDFLAFIDPLFKESGSTEGAFAAIQTKQALHGASLLHKGDPEPIRIYAGSGDVADLTLYTPKPVRILAGRDVTDVGLYLQNLSDEDVSLVSAGRDIVAYNANTPLRAAATATGNYLAGTNLTGGLVIPDPQSGDIQIGGSGALLVLAGRDLDLGSGPNRADGTGVGITSIGNARNLNLPFEGASITAAAGLGTVGGLSENPNLHFEEFITQYLSTGGTQSTRYLADLSTLLNPSGKAETAVPPESALEAFKKLPKERQASIALEIFYKVLRDAGRDSNLAGSPTFGTYTNGEAAIALLFEGATREGNIKTQGRDIRTKSGGNINLLAPGGSLTLATTKIGNPLIPPGVVTEAGGNISVFTNGDVNIGISRIFTLRGGDIMIWSSTGDIAAGTSAKTVRSAPPTRVLVDPQSADVQTDLAGLATGGGIGVLATVSNVPPGAVDLIAPSGTIDAGDAGIRSTGTLNLAAVSVLNADNISAGGATSGVPAPAAPASVNVSGLTSASNTAGSATSAADEAARQTQAQAQNTEETPSIISVDVTYGDEAQ